MPSNPYQVVVDDSNSQVIYTGEGWFPHNSTDLDRAGSFSGTTYLHTLHGTNVSGSLSFSFQGSGVRLSGTNNQKKISSDFDPKWECFVDGVSIGASNPAELVRNNWILCEKNALDDGPHEITLNVTSAGQTFWFDKIQYRPSPNLSFDTVVLLVDNHNAGVVLDSKWGTTSGGGANITQTYGSTATFNFIGTHVEWLGIIPDGSSHNPSSGTYSIDGEPAVSFDLKGGAGMSSQTFFSTPDLPAGPHTLLVTYLGNDQQMPLTYDYLYFTNISLPGGTSTNSGVIPGPTSKDVSQPSGRGSPVGAIVGGVVGGTAGLVILVFIFLWWYKRRRGYALGNSGLTDDEIRYRESGVTPYTYSTVSTPTSGSDLIGDPWTSRQGLHKKRNLRPLRRVDDDAPPRYTEN